jgi:tetratricopeptide (TPR) repeat protein
MIYFMKIFLWSFLCLLFSFSAQGQTESDYLKKWAQYLKEDVDSCLYLFDEISTNSIEKKHIKQLILGSYMVRKDDIDEGLLLLNESLIHYTQTQNYELLCRISNEMGIGYFLSGDLLRAEKYFKNSMNQGQESPNSDDYYLAQLNLAKCYYELQQEDLARYHIQKYLELATVNEKWESASNANGVLFEFALQKGHIKAAKKYAQKQLNFALKSESLNYYLHALTNKGILFFEMGNLDSAQLCFERVLFKRKTENNPMKLFDAYYNMAGILLDVDSSKSHSFIDSAFQLANQNKHFFLSKKAIEFMKIELKMTLPDSAMFFIEKAIQHTRNKNLEKANKLLETTKKDEMKYNILLLWLFTVPIIILFGLYLYRISVRKP